MQDARMVRRKAYIGNGTRKQSVRIFRSTIFSGEFRALTMGVNY